MQIVIEKERFCFQGQVWELADFFASIREMALSGITVREYLHRELH